LLDDLADVEIVGEAGLAREALQLCQLLRPDVVLLDIRLPDQSGVEVCRQMTELCPDTGVIILTSYADDRLVREAILAGASGYVLKQVGSQELVRAIEAVARGEALLDPQITRRVLHHVRQTDRHVQASAFRHLSPREMEVLLLVSEGKSNREIADELSISERTVGNHVSGLLNKLGLGNRIELATYAVKHHIGSYLARDAGG
jgi:DNA-binding NarL/FixJ family response regulator